MRKEIVINSSQITAGSVSTQVSARRVGLPGNLVHIRRCVLIVAITYLSLFGLSASAQTEDVPAPEEVMARFLNAFVAYDYDICRSLLAPDATMTIIRRDETDVYEHLIQPADEWLDEVGSSGVKGLDSFSVDILEASTLTHSHGATVTLKFTAKGRAGTYRFESSGFDTGNLVETPDGWRILHYSSFEDFRSDIGGE